MSSPSCWNAGERVMSGTHSCKNAFSLTYVDAVVPATPGAVHGTSWPSSQRFGVIHEKFAVVDTDLRSVASVAVDSGSASAAHSPELTVDMKYGHGLWRIAY